MRHITSISAVLSFLVLLASPVLADDKDFHDQDIKDKDFSSANLKGANFADAVVRNCNFYKSNVDGANFKGADLGPSANFAGASAKGADFREAKLSLFAYDADFSLCNMEGANMKGVSLLTNKFRGANLQKTTGWTAVSGCDFSNADLRGANLRGMTWMSSDMTPRFRGAVYDDDTTWPDGFDTKAAGATSKPK